MIKLFKIKKGNNYSNLSIPYITFKHKISGIISFKNISYVVEKKYMKDSNKIIGLSNNWHHHQDSVRLCWRMNPKKDNVDDIEIMISYYVNGKRTIIPLTTTKSSSIDNYSIEIEKNSYKLKYNKTSVTIHTTSKLFPVHYLCKPYFGGNAKAPKDFNFEISI